jgi:hypothetical protein
MGMSNASRLGRVVALLLLAGTTVGRAVLFKFTDDPTYNTSEPTGALTNSGWRLQGQWGLYLGTPIAPTFFLAAKHVSGEGATNFTLDGFHYRLISIVSNPAADLVVCQVAETFPAYATLYTNSNEAGRSCMVFGRGTQRGTPVIMNNTTNGWRWGTEDRVLRWGSNRVEEVAGDFLRASFDRAAGSNECHLSVGDSSGAMFIQDGGEWKLAGIHYGVDGPFSNDTYGVINAALLDRGGFCEADGSMCYRDTGQDKPSSFYSTRISPRVAWINSVIHFDPGIDLQITGVQPVGNDVQISFATGSNKVYLVQRRDSLTAGNWTTLTNGVVGTGNVMNYTDIGAAILTQRHYRVGLVP